MQKLDLTVNKFILIPSDYVPFSVEYTQKHHDIWNCYLSWDVMNKSLRMNLYKPSTITLECTNHDDPDSSQRQLQSKGVKVPKSYILAHKSETTLTNTRYVVIQAWNPNPQ